MEENIDLNMDITRLHNSFKKRLLSPVEVVGSLFKKIEKYSHLNAFITICKNKAFEDARASERKFKTNDDLHILEGIPLGLKDLIYTNGIRTTCGSGVFKDFIPTTDAELVKILKQSGSIIIGKQNTHEFAYGTTGDDSYFGPTKNPYDPSRITGGSSGGSASATALRLNWGSIGTDTSGSVRIPSALCGVVGMKPTFGKINNRGVYPLSWSMDHVCPITKTVLDNAILYDTLIEASAEDSIAQKLQNHFSLHVNDIKIGIPNHYFYENIDDEIKIGMDNVIQKLSQLGAMITKVDMPGGMEKAMDISGAIDRSEAYLINKEIAHNEKNLLGKETRRRILQGSKYFAYEYILAQDLKNKLTNDFKEIFNKVDLILTPTVPILPTTIGQEEVMINDKAFNVRSVLMKFTFISNYLGIPSISMPCSISDEGFPISAQFMGNWDAENKLYQVSYELEKKLDVVKQLNEFA